MFDELPIRFDQPIWLLLMLLIIPAFLVSLRSIGGLSRTKAYVTFALRALLIVLLSVALAHPIWEKRGEGLTVTVLLDRSQSIPLPLKQQALRLMREAAELKERPEDRVASITLAKDAVITALPDPNSAVTVGADEADPTATNLAAAVRLALAIVPDDTANRIVLVSDGNETVDHVLEAADLAKANDIPIDVLLLEYEHPNEVIFERINAPARARVGQTAELKLVLRTQSPTTGTVRLKMNDEYLDLNGDEPGDGVRLQLNPGAATALPVSVSLEDSRPHQFEAVFIPDDPAADAIERNNTAVGVTFVGGAGRVMVVGDSPAESRYLVQALQESGIAVDVVTPDQWTGGSIQLNGYDAVVLVNIPKYALDGLQDQLLHDYVHHVGGGLVMIGGDKSFGAGGWIDSEVAKALPVEMNPPQTRQMPAGALALIMHSCEMAQGNFWGQKVAESAIKALSRLDYAGIVEFNWGGAGGIQGCSWAFEMQRLGDKQAALDATKTMTVGDMPAFGPSMELGLQGLIGVPAAQRHAIIISDGDPSPPSNTLLQKYIDNKVTVTTVMVGGHGTAGDRNRMNAVANRTGGQFYNVKNPKNLPQIFIKEAQFVSRSLIQDGDTYHPSVTSLLPGPAQGFPSVPSIDGYVLTAPREGLAQTPMVIPTTEGNDPLFAHWNFGVGRAIAYTSDLTNLWGSRWAEWERFRAFWEQAIRWVMRPSAPTNMTVNTRLEGDIAIVELEALEADTSALNFLRTSAVILKPDGESEPLALQQLGPGRYVGQFRADQAGAYLTNIRFEGGRGDERLTGNLQAAVSVPYAREFRAVKHDAAKMRQLAERTGGRMLSATSPEQMDLFDRRGLPVPKSLKPIWDFLAILAASLLLLDVAARRISVSAQRVAEMFGKAVGRRGEVSQDTVAAWKRAKSQVAHRREAKKQKAAVRSARFEAGEEDAAVAIDVGEQLPRDMREKVGKVKRAEPQPPAEEDEGDFTARLLAAKRRARGEKEGEDEK